MVSGEWLVVSGCLLRCWVYICMLVCCAVVVGFGVWVVDGVGWGIGTAGVRGA